MASVSDLVRAAPASGDLTTRFVATRALTRSLAAPLSDADATIQSMPDASPAKWHLAHTTWFFETFVLRDHLADYRLFDAQWPYLFNSYYEAEGPRHTRAMRGLLSRPSLDEVMAYRTWVDGHIGAVIDRPELAGLIELGINHEQQHQELLLTDIKHALSLNPLGPAYAQAFAHRHAGKPSPATGWHRFGKGIHKVGHRGHGFAFDNEGPAHDVVIEAFALADRLVTNGEWADFIEDGGYRNAALWLSDGWAWAQDQGIATPLYWRGEDAFTLNGWQKRDPGAPVTHVSFYEADAFATWAGVRLPTEFEWEVAASQSDPASGNQLDGGDNVNPQGEDTALFGNCWQWTRSAYLPYPGFRAAKGAVGEYNGKFMSGQCVLKGASCATPRGHARATYRNFFAPDKRWQFSGVRLAKDI